MSNNSNSDQEFINKLHELIESNLENENFGVLELARELGMSRSKLLRKVKAIAKISANQYIKQFRLKKAMEMLQQTSITVSEVSYKMGFGSPSYFVKCFHDYYGYPPGKVGNRNESELQVSEKQNKKRLAVIVSSTFLLFLIVFIVVKPFLFQQKEPEKTIAVLPFIDLSPEKDNAYIIYGLKDEILDKLHNIGDIIVTSSTDTEIYRNTNKSTAEIGKELNVNYLLEGSGQVIGQEIKLRLQLIETSSGNHVLSKSYTKNTNDIFKLQEDVAFSVASELKASLTPEEEQQIEKRPTENMAAYNLYLRGMEHHNLAANYFVANNTAESEIELNKSMKYFKQAIELDSTFAQAYTLLSHFYINIFSPTTDNNTQLNIYYLDSGRYFAEKALKYDPENSWAAGLMGRYYRQKGMEKEAEIWEKKHVQTAQKKLEEYEIYIRQSQNAQSSQDYYNAIRYYYKYLETKPEEVEPEMYQLRGAYERFKDIGYPDLAKSVAEEILIRNNDSIGYWLKSDELNYLFENETSFKFSKKAYEKDSTNIWPLWYLCIFTSFQRNFSDAYDYTQKYLKSAEASGDTFPPFYLYGYIYLQNGYKHEAEKYFNVEIKNYTQEIELNFMNAQRYNSHVLLSAIYSIKGEKEKALNYLKQAQNRKTTFPYLWIKWIKTHPVFDNIRGEPEFQKTLAGLEAKWEKEHERVGKLLRDFGVLE